MDRKVCLGHLLINARGTDNEMLGGLKRPLGEAEKDDFRRDPTLVEVRQNARLH